MVVVVVKKNFKCSDCYFFEVVVWIWFEFNIGFDWIFFVYLKLCCRCESSWVLK